MLDKIIMSRWFNLFPRLVLQLWSPISNRQKFLGLKTFNEIFKLDDAEAHAYAEIYGQERAVKRYPDAITLTSYFQAPRRGSCETRRPTTSRTRQ